MGSRSKPCEKSHRSKSSKQTKSAGRQRKSKTPKPRADDSPPTICLPRPCAPPKMKAPSCETSQGTTTSTPQPCCPQKMKAPSCETSQDTASTPRLCAPPKTSQGAACRVVNSVVSSNGKCSEIVLYKRPAEVISEQITSRCLSESCLNLPPCSTSEIIEGCERWVASTKCRSAKESLSKPNKSRCGNAAPPQPPAPPQKKSESCCVGPPVRAGPPFSVGPPSCRGTPSAAGQPSCAGTPSSSSGLPPCSRQPSSSEQPSCAGTPSSAGQPPCSQQLSSSGLPSCEGPPSSVRLPVCSRQPSSAGSPSCEVTPSSVGSPSYIVRPTYVGPPSCEGTPSSAGSPFCIVPHAYVGPASCEGSPSFVGQHSFSGRLWRKSSLELLRQKRERPKRCDETSWVAKPLIPQPLPPRITPPSPPPPPISPPLRSNPRVHCCQHEPSFSCYLSDARNDRSAVMQSQRCNCSPLRPCRCGRGMSANTCCQSADSNVAAKSPPCQMNPGLPNYERAGRGKRKCNPEPDPNAKRLRLPVPCPECAPRVDDDCGRFDWVCDCQGQPIFERMAKPASRTVPNMFNMIPDQPPLDIAPCYGSTCVPDSRCNRSALKRQNERREASNDLRDNELMAIFAYRRQLELEAEAEEMNEPQCASVAEQAASCGSMRYGYQAPPGRG